MWLFLLSTLLFKRANTDNSFKAFCDSPPNFGIGAFDESVGKCRITYNVKSKNENYAQQFCDRQHPYSLEKATIDGEKTICLLAVYYKCLQSEILIGDRCFIALREGQFKATSSACTATGVKNLGLHKVSNMFEQKWIAAFFTSYKMLWIANTEKDLKYLKAPALKGQTLNNMEGRLVNEKSDKYAIITSKGSVAAFRSGTVVPIKEATQLPVMCSRPAPINAYYPKAITEKMRELGFKSFVYNDATKEPRPFIILRALIEFEMTSEFAAGGKRLHQACESLRNGYAATPLDFDNVNDFRAMLKEAKVNIVGVPGSRTSSVTAENNKQCGKAAYPENYRKDFYFELKNGGMKSAKEAKYWRPTFPDKFCADTPRTALGFSQEGLVDIPNSARMFVVCTYGEESRATDEDRAAKCSKHAIYDKKTDTCTCLNPFSDLKDTKMFVITENERNREQGTTCVNCQRQYDHEFAVVVQNDNYDAYRRDEIKHLLRVFAYIGLVTKSRMKMFLYDDRVKSGRYRIPSGRVYYIRTFFDHDYAHNERDGNKLAPALKKVYEFFKNKATDRKVVVIITKSLPSDLEEAKKAKERLDLINMKSVVISFGENDDLKPLSSTGEVINVEPISIQNGWDLRSDATSHVMQVMIRSACLSDERK